jgi:hypothetical protein
LYVADESFGLNSLLASQYYINKHPKVPREFAILPFQILLHHVENTLEQVQDLSRQITTTERRIADGRINLDDNGDYKLLNRLNLEHIRLQRRSSFEMDLGKNLLKYLDAYQRMWASLWEGGLGYLEDMREKIAQQMRYSEQVQKDLDMMPRRIDNQSHAVGLNFRWYNGREQLLTGETDIELHRAERQQDQSAGRRELTQNRRRKPVGQSAQFTAGESDGADGRGDETRQRGDEDDRHPDAYLLAGHCSGCTCVVGGHVGDETMLTKDIVVFRDGRHV